MFPGALDENLRRPCSPRVFPGKLWYVDKPVLLMGVIVNDNFEVLPNIWSGEITII
jgi:hypothetical protein